MAIINGRGRVGIRRPSVAAIPSIVSDGLKMYLNAGNATSYAGTGTAWTDLSGNGNGGTLVGGAVYSSASGGSISFDGGNDYANLGAAAYFNGLTDITLNFWVLPQTSAAQRIIFSRYNNGTLNGFMVLHDTDNKFYFDGRESNAQYLRVGTLNTYAVDSWHNVTVTKSGNSWKIYINGVLENSATLGLGNVAWLMQNGAQIGAIFQGNGSQIYGKSNVAVAMAYSRALSAAEVLQNYDALKLRFVPLTYSIVSDSLAFHLDAGNVKSYYGTGTAWKDLTGNSNNGALTNGPAYSSDNGGSIVFDGVNDYCVTGNSNVWNLSNNLTIECWVYMTSNTGFRGLFGTFNGNSGYAPYNGYSFVSPSGDTRWSFVVAFTDNTIKYIYSDNNYTLNKWTHLVGTIGGGYSRFYVNGVLQTDNSTKSVKSPGNLPVIIGRFYHNIDSLYFTGKISSCRIYNKALSDTEVLQNYNAMLSRFYPIVSDADAQAFVVAAGLTSSVQANAVNTLVTSMKTAGVWTKMKAVYPMVGGSAAAHKWNLKDPRDLNAAYRLAFAGTGWVHSSTGAKPNGSSDYANTFLNASGVLTIANNHISFYSITNPTTINSVEMGASDIFGYYGPHIRIRLNGFYGYTNTLMYTSGNTNNYAYTLSTNTDARGHFIGNILSTTNRKTYKNGNVSGVNTSNISQTLYNGFIYLGALNNINTAAFYTNRECAFATIGDGLTDAEASSLYTAVQTYQTALGRQV